MTILYIIIGVVLGIGGTYLYFKEIKKLNTHQHFLEEEIDKLQSEKEYWLKELAGIQSELDITQQRKRGYDNDIQILETQKNEITNSIQSLSQQAKEAGDKFFNDQMILAQERFDKAMEELANQYQTAEEDYLKEYKEVLSDLAADAQVKQNDLVLIKNKILEVQNTLKDESSKVNAVVEANKRAQEEQDAKNFYRLQIPEADLLEIEKLKEIIPLLRDPEVLNKAIWKMYYEKPYTDLIGRVFGKAKPIGIYKITNLINGMVYVGQAMSVPDRWKEHMRRAVGADTPTKNKLYPAMAQFGVENFTFELLEVTTKDQLNEREDFYQEFYHAQDYGYSIK